MVDSFNSLPSIRSFSVANSAKDYLADFDEKTDQLESVQLYVN